MQLRLGTCLHMQHAKLPACHTQNAFNFWLMSGLYSALQFSDKSPQAYIMTYSSYNQFQPINNLAIRWKIFLNLPSGILIFPHRKVTMASEAPHHQGNIIGKSKGPKFTPEKIPL